MVVAGKTGAVGVLPMAVDELLKELNVELFEGIGSITVEGERKKEGHYSKALIKR